MCGTLLWFYFICVPFEWITCAVFEILYLHLVSICFPIVPFGESLKLFILSVIQDCRSVLGNRVVVLNSTFDYIFKIMSPTAQLCYVHD